MAEPVQAPMSFSPSVAIRTPVARETSACASMLSISPSIMSAE